MTAAAWLMLAAALIAFAAMGMTLRNLARYLPAPPVPSGPPTPLPLVSVCIPARDEEENIEPCVTSILRSEGLPIEVLVYDDQSTDATPRIIAALAAGDPRVRPVPTVPLPAGWNGKQHASWRMAQAAAGRWLLFTDADVRFEPDAIARAVALAEQLDVGLLSTFPRQRTGTLGEALLIPMIHFILLSYLPIGRMRATTEPASSAGCGQFLLARRDAYDASGGHSAFKDSMHDGVRMPRAIRRAGFRTDLFDGTDLAACRMYRGLRATWRGFAKNAYEGLGSAPLLAGLSTVHLLGHVVPWVHLGLVLAGVVVGDDHAAVALAALAVVFNVAQRTALALRFRQPAVAIPLHPISITLMTLIQWHSLALHLLGRRSWRGRTQGSAASPSPEQPAHREATAP